MLSSWVGADYPEKHHYTFYTSNKQHNPFSILIMMSQDSAAAPIPVVRPNVACGCLGPGPESGY